MARTAFNWFKSYLSYRLFCVTCSHDLSEPHQSCYGVLHGSVLGPLPFSHHLYADDTQFISFQPTKFNENIFCLQTALSAIADWMTSNLLCFNSAKTEFLLLGLKPQLNKIHNEHLPSVMVLQSVPHPQLTILVSSLMPISPFPIRFLHLLTQIKHKHSSADLFALGAKGLPMPQIASAKEKQEGNVKCPSSTREDMNSQRLTHVQALSNE